jgi:tetratricopeptide (TPR) repeat protein
MVAGREGPLQRLGRVGAAPRFAGVPVRADADSASRLADQGMAAYVARRYAEATRLLGAVAAVDRTPALTFYLGVSQLLSGKHPEAVGMLRGVPPESPYSAEARFYLAKAWLRLGAADSALAALAAVPAASPIAAPASALADSVKGVLR